MLDSLFKKDLLKFLNMNTQNNQLKGLENIRKPMPHYEGVFGEDTKLQGSNQKQEYLSVITP